MFFPFPNNIVAAIPLNSSCSFCNAETAHQACQSTIQVPVQVHLSTGFPSSHSQPPRAWKLGENRFLEHDETMAYTPQFAYLPPPKQKRNLKRLKQPSRFKSHHGMEKLYQQRQLAQLQASLVSKRKLQRSDKMLKRLQNHHARRLWKAEKLQRYDEVESIRQSKLEMLRRRKGIQSDARSECGLWNCPRKKFQRKRPFMSLQRERSVSCLSNLSKRSRSPIIFRK